MGNYFSEMNCIKATVITETNTEPYFDEVKKDENIEVDVKEPNPICDKKEECCDIEDCCKNKKDCSKKDCSKKDCCVKKEEKEQKEQKEEESVSK
jgi:hypothetical protein